MNTVKSIEEATKPNLKKTLKGIRTIFWFDCDHSETYLFRYFVEGLGDIFKIFFAILVFYAELGLLDGHEIYVADPTTPTSLTFRLQLASKMDDWFLMPWKN